MNIGNIIIIFKHLHDFKIKSQYNKATTITTNIAVSWSNNAAATIHDDVVNRGRTFKDQFYVATLLFIIEQKFTLLLSFLNCCKISIIFCNPNQIFRS